MVGTVRQHSTAATRTSIHPCSRSLLSAPHITSLPQCSTLLTSFRLSSHLSAVSLGRTFHSTRLLVRSIDAHYHSHHRPRSISCAPTRNSIDDSTRPPLFFPNHHSNPLASHHTVWCAPLRNTSLTHYHATHCSRRTSSLQHKASDDLTRAHHSLRWSNTVRGTATARALLATTLCHSQPQHFTLSTHQPSSEC